MCKTFGFGGRSFPYVMPNVMPSVSTVPTIMPTVSPTSTFWPTTRVMNSMTTGVPLVNCPITTPVSTLQYPFIPYPYLYGLGRWMDKDVYEDEMVYDPEGDMDRMSPMSPYVPPIMYPTTCPPISPYGYPLWYPWIKMNEDYRVPEREYTWGEPVVGDKMVGSKVYGNRMTSRWLGGKSWMGDRMTTPIMPMMYGMNRMGTRMMSTMTGNRWMTDRLSPMSMPFTRSGMNTVNYPDGSCMTCYPNGWCCFTNTNGLTTYLPFIPPFLNPTGFSSSMTPFNYPTGFTGSMPPFNCPTGFTGSMPPFNYPTGFSGSMPPFNYPTGFTGSMTPFTGSMAPFTGMGMSTPSLMPPGLNTYSNWLGYESEDPQFKSSLRAWFDCWITGEFPLEQMTREDCIGILLYYRRECCMTFHQLAEKLNRSELWTICAFFGQHRLTWTECETVCEVLGVDKKLRSWICKLLNKEPSRCSFCLRNPVPFHCHYLH